MTFNCYGIPCYPIYFGHYLPKFNVPRRQNYWLLGILILLHHFIILLTFQFPAINFISIIVIRLYFLHQTTYELSVPLIAAIHGVFWLLLEFS